MIVGRCRLLRCRRPVPRDAGRHEWRVPSSPSATSRRRSRPTGGWARRPGVAHTEHELGGLLRPGGTSGRGGAAPRRGSCARRAGRHAHAGRPRAPARVGFDGQASAPDELSVREIDVLRLVSQGLSNREVGETLHLSQHTVANHVGAILRKTRTGNRTEAAAYAHRRGLTVPVRARIVVTVPLYVIERTFADSWTCLRRTSG